MSFSKPKAPPVQAAGPTPEEVEAKKVEAAHNAQVEYSRERRAGNTDVAGSRGAAEEQEGRGLINKQRRERASQTLYHSARRG